MLVFPVFPSVLSYGSDASVQGDGSVSGDVNVSSDAMQCSHAVVPVFFKLY